MKSISLAMLLLALAFSESRAATPSVSAGDYHTLALHSDGTVRSWGSDANGQLGIGRLGSSTTPLHIPTIDSAATTLDSVAAGNHVLLVQRDGTVLAWGSNFSGGLGDGTTIDRSTPVQVIGLSGITAVAAFGGHSMALAADRTVWSWGGGAAGDGDPTEVHTQPVHVPNLTNVVAISVGGQGGGTATTSSSMVVKSDGTVWAWGDNSDGQLGDGTRTRRTTPVQVAITGVVRVAVGGRHALAIKSDGTVWAWGANDRGQLGDGTTNPSLVPKLVSGVTAVRIAASESNSYAVRPDGAVLVWGFSANPTMATTPTVISGIPPAVDIKAPFNVMVLAADGSVWTSGLNDFGQLGHPADPTGTLHIVPGLGGVSAIAAGSIFSIAIAADRTAYSWGGNLQGQLGIAQELARSTASVVSGLAGVVQVATSRGINTEGHSAALKTDGTVWNWGLGAITADGTRSSATPVQVIGLTNIVQISTGGSNLALRSDGTVWTWNAHGSVEAPQVLTQVPISNVRRVSSGSGHNLAVKGDGTVWAWGNNDYGQLGVAVAPDFCAGPNVPCAISPVQVPGISDAVDVAAGGRHSLALRVNGSVLAWGANNAGQLGDGTTVGRSTPVPVQGLSGVVQIDAGGLPYLPPNSPNEDGHSIARTADGSVWAWGANSFGQLGDGTSNRRVLPAPVSGVSGAVSVSAGVFHTAIVLTEGTVLTWGSNQTGQLGDGSFATRSKPVVVLAEGGGGSLQTNDWYLDLDPSTPNIIPADRIPTFLLKASGDVTAAILQISVDARFRPQDVGKAIRVFAYTPASIAKLVDGEKADACVLTQPTPNGMQQSSAGNLSTIGNVSGAQSQSFNMIRNVPGSQAAGSCVCVGTGSGTEATNAANMRCAATIPAGSSGTTCTCPDGTTISPSANIPGPLSGLWWNANESGWGIHFTQRGTNVFAAWYTYDASGNPKWYVSTCGMVSGATGTAGACNGQMYEVNGPTFFGTAFNTALVHAVPNGNLQVAFQNSETASMTYSGVSGQTRTVAITRQPLATGTAQPAINYTDIWWAGQNESGWGMAITQQFSTMFLAWYVYDGTGKPMWYVATCTLSGTTCAGSLQRTTGPAFGPTFNPGAIQVFTAGTVSVNFTDGNNATLNYTVNGVSASKNITRQLF